jgi:uncharacterized membrane protein YoaT (DUF817 family)
LFSGKPENEIVWFRDNILHKYGYLNVLNHLYLHDFTRYLFMLVIVGGILSAYSVELVYSFPVPDAKRNSRSKMGIVPVIVLLIVGQYIELYCEIWAATVREAKFELLEIGSWLGYAGLFSLLVIYQARPTWFRKITLA